MPTPTAEQLTAIHDRDHDLVVTAGAGSGKTFVLVERYLYLLEVHPDWTLDQVVAITFTEKAAREMRNRVRAEIERRAAAERGSTSVWRPRHLQLESARISTIHSFCAGLLRANAAEAGLDPAFSVLDEIETRLLIRQAVEEELLALAEREGDPALPLLIEYEGRLLHRLLGELLGGGAVVLRQLQGVPDDPATILTMWRAALEQARREALEALAADSSWWAAFDFLSATTADDPTDRLVPMRSLALECAASLDGPTDGAMAALRRLASEVDLRGGRTAAWGDRETLAAIKAALKTMRERARATDEALGLDFGPADERAAALLPLWKRLTEATFARFERLKARRGALDFDDLEARSADLLTRHPEVRHRLRREIHHLLVDEFQDTNDLQVAIVDALAGETPGRLFVVGDQKQSIYRFRGAVVELFDALSQRRRGCRHALTINFRSHAPFVRACNHLFGALFTADGPSQVSFETLEANRLIPPDEEPPLELILVPVGLVPHADGKADAENERRWEASALATRLRALVGGGRRVHDPRLGQSRPLAWGDVAILFRATTDLPLYEEVFKQAGLPFVTVAGRGFYGRQEVRDLLNLLTAVASADGSEDLALASVLRSPLFGLSDEALLWLAVHRAEGQPLHTCLAEPPVERLHPDDLVAVRHAHAVLSRLRALAGRVTILELLHAVIQATGFLATLSSLPDGDRRRGNVEKLLEVARARGSVLLSDFNRYVQDLTTQETRESEALVATQGAVQLLTIHAAKGLEFPVVVLADASRRPGPGNGGEPLLLARHRGLALKVSDGNGESTETVFYRLLKREELAGEQAETTRLLYVAATRARDLLIVSGRVGQRTGKDWLSRLLDTLECPRSGDDEVEVLHREWGQVRLWRLQQWPPDLDGGGTPQVDLGLWESETLSGASPFADLPAAVPALLDEPLPSPLEPSRQLSATALNLLLGDERDVARYRQQVEGAPGELRPSLAAEQQREPWGWQIGEIARSALARWQLPGHTPDLAALLEVHAWNLGLTDPALTAQAARKAAEILQRFERSALCTEISASSPRFFEVPFTIEWQGRLVSGQVDALYQRQEGYWTLVEFKTHYIPPDRTAESFALERYGPSLALGQLAASRWLGARPSVTVFFLFQGRIARLPLDDLRKRLELASAKMRA